MQTVFEDFFSGFAFAQITALVWGVWSLGVGVIAGFCWVGGGQGWLNTKAWRRVGVGIAICLPFILEHHILGGLISFALQCAWQTVGYGEIDVNDPTGSWLGRICGKWTRVVWYLGFALTLAPLFL